ncbi:LysM peptidoglycan-binding domain-containing protein, partial [Actinocorallia lasiicapitis]
MTMQQRQPVRVKRRSAADVLAGLAALVALLALVVGVPFGLIALAGSPLDWQPPALSQLTEQITVDDLLGIIGIVVWLAWLQLMVCLLVEVQAGVRGIGVPSRVPLAGATQALVHKLVVSVLLLFSATTAIMPAFTAQIAMPQTTNVAHYQPMSAPVAQVHEQGMTPEALAAQGEEGNATAKIYRVNPPHGRHHESLWEIAEKCLGDGRRYQEIYELNKGHVQPDGSHLHKASLIRPGWIMEMPADAEHTQIIPKSDLQDYFHHGHPVPDRPRPSDNGSPTPSPNSPQPPAPGSGSTTPSPSGSQT